MKAQELVARGYYQVSRAHRIVARFPDGMNGIEALTWASKRKKWAEQLGEVQAGDQFLRCYARGELIETLDSATWDEYMRLGGGTYERCMMAKPSPPSSNGEEK